MKKIITLGHSSSGKSCYMSAAISYLYSYGSEWVLSTEDTNLDRLTDNTERTMRSGKWPAKTTGKMTYTFKRPSAWNSFISAISFGILEDSCFTVDTGIELVDWTGEAFTAAGIEKREGDDQAALKWEQLSPNTREDFVTDCKEADAFLLFLDGERLLEGSDEERATRESLYWLKDILVNNKKNRKFVILITKSDYLEDTEEFGDRNGHVYSDKICDRIRSMFPSFFGTLKGNSYDYRMMPVTCIPVREHRKETVKGTFPSEKWTLMDMASSNIADPVNLLEKNDLVERRVVRQRYVMIDPFRWILDQL